jgi:hypothetical protein
MVAEMFGVFVAIAACALGSPRTRVAQTLGFLRID